MRGGSARQLRARRGWAILDGKARGAWLRREESSLPSDTYFEGWGQLQAPEGKGNGDQRNTTRRTPHSFHCTPPVLRSSQHFTRLNWRIYWRQKRQQELAQVHSQKQVMGRAAGHRGLYSRSSILGREPRECVINMTNSGLLWVPRGVGNWMIPKKPGQDSGIIIKFPISAPKENSCPCVVSRWSAPYKWPYNRALLSDLSLIQQFQNNQSKRHWRFVKTQGEAYSYWDSFIYSQEASLRT